MRLTNIRTFKGNKKINLNPLVAHLFQTLRKAGFETVDSIVKDHTMQDNARADLRRNITDAIDRVKQLIDKPYLILEVT